MARRRAPSAQLRERERMGSLFATQPANSFTSLGGGRIGAGPYLGQKFDDALANVRERFLDHRSKR
jgi:hypothetical protein